MFDFLGDFFSGITDPIVNWVQDAFGNSVAAVAGATLQGSIAGALSGAAFAAFKGGDIFKGALKGAAYGGIATGLASSLGQMSGIESFSAENQLNYMGYKDKSLVSNPAATSSFRDPQGDGGLLSTTNKASDVRTPLEQTTTGLPSKEVPKSNSFWGSDAGGKVLAGGVQGLAVGAGNYLSAEATAKGRMQELSLAAQIDKDKIAANKASNPTDRRRIKAITTKQWWDNRIGAE